MCLDAVDERVILWCRCGKECIECIECATQSRIEHDCRMPAGRCRWWGGTHEWTHRTVATHSEWEELPSETTLHSRIRIHISLSSFSFFFHFTFFLHFLPSLSFFLSSLYNLVTRYPELVTLVTRNPALVNLVTLEVPLGVTHLVLYKACYSASTRSSQY